MNKQQGFSLFEVLIAMLIAAVGIAAVMGVHNANLRHVRDHAQLNQAQLILNNTVYRLQQTADVDAVKKVNTFDLAGLTKKIDEKNKGWLVQILWPAHVAEDAVVRSGCVEAEITAGYHCLAMWVAQ